MYFLLKAEFCVLHFDCDSLTKHYKKVIKLSKCLKSENLVIDRALLTYPIVN